MKFLLATIVAMAACGIAAPPATPQTTPPPAPQQAPQPSPQNGQPSGKVIFSRSTDENGQTSTQAGPAATPPAIEMASAPSAQDAERQAVTFTSLDLDVHLRTAEQSIAVRALLTVRNDGKTPLAHIPLQISSSLNWERIRVNGRDATFPVATLNSDADHTGQLHEAAILLSEPLPPGASLQLDVTYSGPIAPSARRLLAIGTPDDVALHSDWDAIGVPFTGLRGFGNVVWYPVSSVPVILGDGARLFDEMGEHKLRLAGAHFRLKLTAEFPHGQAPTVALINGHPAPLTVTDAASEGQEITGVATAAVDDAALGYQAPSLFLAIRTAHSAKNAALWTLPEDDSAAQDWLTAATAVTPFLENWLGERPHAQLAIIDLPDPQDAPFETGAMLAAPIRQATPQQLDGVLVHALAHAYIHSQPQSPAARLDTPAWLDEGVAQFMSTLWVQRQSGHARALEALEASRTALALAEPSSPGESAGQPLDAAISPAYYRTKAAYILWMLRDLAGDDAVSAALHAYNSATGPSLSSHPSPHPSTSNALGRNTTRSSFEKLIEQAGNHRDLAWFFADWVDADKGLPDLTIDSVFPSAAEAGNWLVAVNVSNAGYASAEVPVTVRSEDKSVTQRLLVPARGKAVQRILILGKPTEVQVNDGTVPETQASLHITRLGDSAGSPSSPPQSSPSQPSPSQPSPPQPNSAQP